MLILQLCCFTNQWSDCHQVESIDIRFGKNVLDTPPDYGVNFDLVVSAPPCDQFTKAGSMFWKPYPWDYIQIAQKCLDVSLNSGKDWILENPPGRIEKFIPALTQFRRITWNCPEYNKEYVLYSNMLLLTPYTIRYGKGTSINNRTKKQREAWLPQLVQYFESVTV
jgi:hypothetical protein